MCQCKETFDLQKYSGLENQTVEIKNFPSTAQKERLQRGH